MAPKETPLSVKLVGGAYLLINGLALLGVVVGILVSLTSSLMVQVPIWVLFLGLAQTLLLTFAAYKLLRMQFIGWIIIVIAELLELLRLVIYTVTPHEYAIADIELAKAADTAGIVFGFVIMAIRLGALFYIKKYMSKFEGPGIDIKKDWLPWG